MIRSDHWLTEPNSAKIQLTLKQSGFELHGFICTRIFSNSKYYVATRSMLVENMDVGPRIWRNQVYGGNVNTEDQL